MITTEQAKKLLTGWFWVSNKMVAAAAIVLKRAGYDEQQALVIMRGDDSYKRNSCPCVRCTTLRNWGDRSHV